MESRTGIRVIKSSRIIPLPPVDWGGGDLRDVALLEITTSEGITGPGSAYTGVNQLRDALTLYQQDPATLHNADAEMTIPMSAIDRVITESESRQHSTT